MDLEHSTEPLRQIALVVTAVLTAIGVGLTSIVGMVDWAWLPPAAVGISSAAGILAAWFGLERGRAVVTPQPHVDQIVRTLDAEIGEIPVEYLGPDLDRVDVIPNDTEGEAPDLGEATSAAGLD